ncbi:Ubiquitin-protein ligase E3A [Tritrichomonas musculus]|uniref:HECT-type E3 ubiquitin transferase n=1 Tax=Tritrichomonas musculus TaxID=1915356 RepID=A0ABR2KNL5_9EUKA
MNGIQDIIDKNFYKPKAFPLLFLPEGAGPITEENLQFDDFILQVLREEKTKININIGNLLNTLDEIYQKESNLLAIRSILLLFAFKNIINIYPFFTDLLSEDKKVKATNVDQPVNNRFEYLIGTESRFFTKPFYNELSKHRALMLDVIESIHHFVECCSLQYDEIYSIIYNIILANEHSLTPVNCTQLNFMEPKDVKEDYKNKIIKHCPVILPFSIKYEDYAKDNIPELKVYFTVNREDLLQTIWNLESIEDINVCFKIAFTNEDGIDCGGLTKEFIEIAFKEICKPESDLFDLRDNYYWFKYHNLDNIIDKEFLMQKYYCVGLFLGVVVLNKRTIPIHFPKYFYKKLLHRDIDQTDLCSFDQDYYKSIISLLETDVTEDLYLFYSYTDSLGHYEIDLETYKDITDLNDFEPPLLTNENKYEYFHRIADWVFNRSIKEEFEAFEKGFLKIRHSPMLYNSFRLDEIDLIISGPYEYDWESLKKGARYSGYEKDSQNIYWFWDYFDELSEEKKLNVVKFITSSTSAPPGGLEALHIKFARIDGKGLPRAHTCFNKIDLPEYDSYEQLEEKCNIAFSYSECFGMS